MNLLDREIDSTGKGGVKKQKKWQHHLTGMMVLVKQLSASYGETISHFTFIIFSLCSHTVKGHIY